MTARSNEALRDPLAARRVFDRLDGRREALQKSRDERAWELKDLVEYLDAADEIKATLERFSDELFKELVDALESQLTRALQDVLDQPIELKVDTGNRNGTVTMAFYVERGGEREDIMKGQGGSVVNILSVGLRLLALAGEDQKRHRRFLILDEQDCWLRPDLVPRFVQIVRDAGKQMGFQVLMISHHSPSMFEKYADRIYRCDPKSDGDGTYASVRVVPPLKTDASDTDQP